MVTSVISGCCPWHFVLSCSVVSDSATPWTVAFQAPLFMEFSRQECWSGLPFPSPGDLPDPGIEPGSPALQADALQSEPPGRFQALGLIEPKPVQYQCPLYHSASPQTITSHWFYHLTYIFPLPNFPLMPARNLIYLHAAAQANLL